MSFSFVIYQRLAQCRKGMFEPTSKIKGVRYTSLGSQPHTPPFIRVYTRKYTQLKQPSVYSPPLNLWEGEKNITSQMTLFNPLSMLIM